MGEHTQIGMQELSKMMEMRFSANTIDTAVFIMRYHSDRLWLAQRMLDVLNSTNITEKKFWSYLQDDVLTVDERLQSML